MHLSPPDIESILKKLGIDALNNMQAATLQAFESNKEIILLSNTGSGKTLAFLLPVLEIIDATKPRTTQALITAPSRELALQIEQVFKAMGTGHKITCCYGGHLRETEENNLLEAPAVIVGTAGRLADHIRRGNIKTGEITLLVLDEFDKLMELGFQEEIEFIINSMQNLRHRMLISATDALAIPEFVGTREPLKLDFLEAKKENLVDFKVLRCGSDDKMECLYRLLCLIGDRTAIVFSSYRDRVEDISNYLSDEGLDSIWYHGALEQKDREVALCKFRNGTARTLVTTDLASRGLDIDNIRYIIHYDPPPTEDIFIHRNGRTARMDASGSVVLMISPMQRVPEYIQEALEEITLPDTTTIPEKTKWSTLFFGAGKKNKINKIDIVGFLVNKGSLKKEDIGLIEVKDFFSFAAVRKNRLSFALNRIKNEKIKNQKIKIDIAK